MATSKAAINTALLAVADTPHCAWVTAQAASGDPALMPNYATLGRYIVYCSAASQRRFGESYAGSYECLVTGDNSVPVTLPTALFKTGVSGSRVVDRAGSRTITLHGMTATSGTDHTMTAKAMLTSSATGYASLWGLPRWQLHQGVLGKVQ